MVLFGQHSADGKRVSVAVRKMPTTSVRRRISLFDRSLG
jgi:hypothetical protein